MQSNKELLVLVILAAIICLVWVATDIYRTQSSVEISPALKEALEPINPNFDAQTLNFIQNLNTSESSESANLVSP